jgi:hypothetical protein
MDVLKRWLKGETFDWVSLKETLECFQPAGAKRHVQLLYAMHKLVVSCSYGNNCNNNVVIAFRGPFYILFWSN